MNRKKLFSLFIPVIIAFSIFFGYLAITNLLESRENRAEYKLYDGSKISLVIGPDLINSKYPPIIRDNEIALDLNTIRRHIDSTVDWDKKNGKVTVTTRDRLVRMKTDNLTAFVNDRQEVRLDLPVFEENDTVYLPLKFLSDFFQVRVTYDKTNKVVIVDDRRAIIQTAAVVEKGAVIRLGRSIKEPVVKKYANSDVKRFASGTTASGSKTATESKGGLDADSPADGDAPDENDIADGAVGADGVDGANGASLSDLDDFAFDMYVFEDFDEWYKVRTPDGIIGYIEKKYVSVRRFVDRIALAESRSSAWKPENGKIIMVWEQVHSAGANPDTSKIPDMPGLDIVSPTWFSLVGKDGSIESKASTSYIEWAHNRGYQVWALFANTMGDIEMTSNFLNDSLSRENAIRSLLAYTAMLDVDGINLDFENVYLKDRDALTQFVRELAPMLREQGLTFSVDVNIPDGSDTWSRCYDTPSIAEAADYINLMAYDQFGANSRESGSVSQLSWVESNLVKLIDRDGVPAEKILLGIPFYTRIWEMERANSPRGDPPKNSSAVGMKTAINGVFDNNAVIEWDAASGQFFCSYKKDGKNYNVWLEDPHSANLRSSLAHKYALAGVSAWSRNFVIPEIWEVLQRNLKGYATYSQWLAEASIDSPDLDRIRQ